jgi:hypothetical protein
MVNLALATSTGSNMGIEATQLFCGFQRDYLIDGNRQRGFIWTPGAA